MTTQSLEEFVQENGDLLARVLACGSPEARAYALAILANQNDLAGIEAVEDSLERIKREVD